jgi:6-phosphogluconolactonase (cycloisomerase 2 family)
MEQYPMNRGHIRRILRVSLAFGLFLITFAGNGFAAAAPAAQGEKERGGAVYALTNAPTGNEVVVWNRAADGSLSPAGSYATGGLGSGAGLGSQGAIILSKNGRWLFAVNAGSNDISVFRTDDNGLRLVHRVPSGGTLPTSLTVFDDLLYVLNAGDSGNITGFKIRSNGHLTQIADSTRPLSGTATAPAQVSFSPDGDVLVVTERATNLIDTYIVDEDGRTSGFVSHPSSGATPFGFAFGKRGDLVVSEANGVPGGSSASSYDVDDDGNVEVISGSVATNQGAACWVVITKNGRFAFTANAASGSISGFQVGRDGSLRLLNADGRTGVTGDNPSDMALSQNSQYLYVRIGRTGSIAAFAVQADGSLQLLAGANGLSANSAGLAAR